MENTICNFPQTIKSFRSLKMKGKTGQEEARENDRMSPLINQKVLLNEYIKTEFNACKRGSSQTDQCL